MSQPIYESCFANFPNFFALLSHGHNRRIITVMASEIRGVNEKEEWMKNAAALNKYGGPWRTLFRLWPHIASVIGSHGCHLFLLLFRSHVPITVSYASFIADDRVRIMLSPSFSLPSAGVVEIKGPRFALIIL